MGRQETESRHRHFLPGFCYTKAAEKQGELLKTDGSQGMVCLWCVCVCVFYYRDSIAHLVKFKKFHKTQHWQECEQKSLSHIAGGNKISTYFLEAVCYFYQKSFMQQTLIEYLSYAKTILRGGIEQLKLHT